MRLVLNTAQLAAFDQYVVDSINEDETPEQKTTQERICFIYDQFEQQTSAHKLKQFNNNVRFAFREWLLGMPQFFLWADYYDEIKEELLKMGYSLEFIIETDFINKWFHMITSAFFRLLEKHKIMRSVKVIFENSTHNYTTKASGTNASLKAYFVGTSFNMGGMGWNHKTNQEIETEDFHQCINVEFV